MATNREKLNQISNEELAEIIVDIESLDTSCVFCAYANISPEKICSKPRGGKCKDGILQWLNQENEQIMTNKEIIANGIDVSECEFLRKEKLPKKVCNNGNLDCDCNSNPNCYFKQLKRKEKECEKYEQALNEIEKYLDAQQKYFDGEDYHNLLDIINKTKGEINDSSI